MGTRPVRQSRPPSRVKGFDVGYVDGDGVERRVPLRRARAVRFEDGLPVRSFPSYRGQRSYPGLYWSATTGGHVGFESWLERDHAVALDFDPQVIGYASQPMWLFWEGESGRVRCHAPDFFARLSDGRAMVIDSRPVECRSDERDIATFAATKLACAQAGWDYALWGEADEVWVANVRWLAGYRHARCRNEAVANRLQRYFARPGMLLAGAEETGDPIATLPVLFHLLWRQELTTDLSVLLSDRTVVHATANRPGEQ
ncbi:TnsA-like heteromeric transposase endonuclease subunit [Streptomyces kaniharaensis]|uniref:TnsA-like heteromeric transposase endonuclease subunit n=1 Tax=Streptomyces kaniharaensis TaxID=212423 RepID=A0A6N7KMY8_9ACTN|nr:TnsA-like heteromeric transposase endonuclease subunit [Streptomyces kaniharaensis]